ncbi:thioesterase domain-containing protein [Streptomyces canus]|uniref:thioesterase domain-containing protein n=1 Tax=Streptomyces TaxID=1883 RepID=UPI000A9BC448|nr:thioesterase domain-containing protein [Streptomyces sp. NBRC 110468]
MPILFIHGITVRRKRFDGLLGEVEKGFAAASTTAYQPVKPCYWGDLGRSESYTGATIPGFAAGARELESEVPADSAVGLLTALLEAPLAELAGLRDAEDFGEDAAGFLPVPEGVEQRNQRFDEAEVAFSSRVASLAPSVSGPYPPLDHERVGAIVHAIFGEAKRADRVLDIDDLCPPVARAITAWLYQETVAGDLLAGGFRWNQAVDLVETALREDDQLGGERGMFKELAKGLASESLTFAFRAGLRNRIMPGLSLFLGDVLAWFRNRTQILERVDAAVRDAGNDGPLAIIGHSLGGVIAFEYCMGAGRDVEFLGTVGSQVGLFAELGALHQGTEQVTGEQLNSPARVGAWLNIYDPDDTLSFLAAPMFALVNDIILDTGAPFPAAHSEYWNLPETYRKLSAGWAQ